MNKETNLIKEGIIFDAKPDAIPFNYRITYKISILCMIMKICCGRRGCSLIKMHIISTAITDKEYRNRLEQFLKERVDREFIVRFEPAVNRALEYALSDGFITQQQNGTYKLTEKGKILASKIMEDKTIFQYEKLVLQKLGPELTEEKIRAISERWKYRDAKN